MKQKIEKIANVKSGVLFKESINPDKEGNVNVIQLKNMDENGRISFSDFQKINMENIDPKNFLAKGDVLLKAKTNHPVAGVITENVSNTIATSHYFILNLKSKDILPEYFAWFLNQRPAQIYINKNSGGTRIQVINKQALCELEVQIPALDIQQKIVKVSQLHKKEQDLIDNIREEKHKLISAQLLNAIEQ